MALYADLQTVRADATFQRRVQEALLITARGILASTGTIGDPSIAARLRLARLVLSNKQSYGEQMVDLLIAQFNAQTTAAMLAVTDTTLQTAVDNIFPALAA